MEKPSNRNLMILLLGISLVVSYGMHAWLLSHRPLSDQPAPGKTKRNGQSADARPAAAPRPIVAHVNGTQASIVAPQGQSVALGESFISAPEESLLQLENPDSGAAVKWTDSRLALVRGQGTTTLTVSGFAHIRGRLQITFHRKTGAEFRIKVPGAFLAILGTTIAFHLDAAGGGLILLEGQVTVKPDDPTQQPFGIQPGQALQITATSPVLVPTIPLDWLAIDDDWSRSVTKALTQLEPETGAEAPEEPAAQLPDQDDHRNGIVVTDDGTGSGTFPEPIRRLATPPSTILRQHGR